MSSTSRKRVLVGCPPTPSGEPSSEGDAGGGARRRPEELTIEIPTPASPRASSDSEDGGAAGAEGAEWARPRVVRARLPSVDGAAPASAADTAIAAAAAVAAASAFAAELLHSERSTLGHGSVAAWGGDSAPQSGLATPLPQPQPARGGRAEAQWGVRPPPAAAVRYTRARGGPLRAWDRDHVQTGPTPGVRLRRGEGEAGWAPAPRPRSESPSSRTPSPPPRSAPASPPRHGILSHPLHMAAAAGAVVASSASASALLEGALAARPSTAPAGLVGEAGGLLEAEAESERHRMLATGMRHLHSAPGGRLWSAQPAKLAPEALAVSPGTLTASTSLPNRKGDGMRASRARPTAAAGVMRQSIATHARGGSSLADLSGGGAGGGDGEGPAPLQSSAVFAEGGARTFVDLVRRSASAQSLAPAAEAPPAVPPAPKDRSIDPGLGWRARRLYGHVQRAQAIRKEQATAQARVPPRASAW
eukprot:tig00021276_g19900.t1